MLSRIALSHVSVHLGGRRALSDVTWSLEAGQHWAFVGANGSGKSTLLRVIAGTQWIDSDGGTRAYSPDGVARESVVRARAWVRHVSAEQHERYARLDLPLAGWTVIASGFDDGVYVHRPLGDDERARVDALVAQLELGGFADRPLNELSSGQVRRLLIARALVRRPLVLVLDEFTNGLDRAARADILAFLDRLSPGVALVVASHRAVDFPAATTHTAVLRDGTIAATSAGPPPRRGHARVGKEAAGAHVADAPVLLHVAGADVYRGETLVLRTLDFDLRRGEHTVIRGANGSGKSTLAGLIAGTIAPASGATVVRFGQTGPFDIWKLKERVAHVSDDLQIAYTLGESVEAVVASGFWASIGLWREPTAEQHGIVTAIIARLGLSALRGRTFTQLSFGERRKVLIARSLVRHPSIFILDEVWNGLDAAFRTALHALLLDVARAGTTLVVIAHDEDDELAALAARVCTLENGRVTTHQRASGR